MEENIIPKKETGIDKLKVGLVILVILLIAFFGLYLLNSEVEDSECTFSQHYYECLALQQDNTSFCSVLDEENKDACEDGYYMMNAFFKQDINMCNNLNEERRIPFCRFLVNGDINECPEAVRDSCIKIISFDIKNNPNIESMNDVEVQLWNMRVAATAFAEKDKDICELSMNTKEGNKISKVRCEAYAEILDSSRSDFSYCKKRYKSLFC